MVPVLADSHGGSSLVDGVSPRGFTWLEFIGGLFLSE
jgi:hypothetical protein